MEQTVINYLLQQGVAIVILAIGLYYMTKYFMGQIDKKDQQNQTNLDRFISLVEKSNEFMSKQINAVEGIHPKLEDIHNDIKAMKNR